MGRFSEIEIDWSPFTTCLKGVRAQAPRSLSTPEGLGDRLRFVAFAEMQAARAFFHAAKLFDVSERVRDTWLKLAQEEEKHLHWLLDRMRELSINTADRPQSLALWHSFDHCESPQKFAQFMANSEEYGRKAGEMFYQTLLKIDPVTAAIFQKIAEEEVEHIALANSVLE